jgi:L-rhamnose isomerase
MGTDSVVESAYAMAREAYASCGVDTEAALTSLSTIAISLHCWQGDDVVGFERKRSTLGGGLATTGNYPGRARTATELRSDAAKAFSMIPGTHRLNLHACYGEFDGLEVDRNDVRPEHFASWIEWAKMLGIGLDFNPTFFGHPLSADNFTLAHRDPGIRRFWIEHGIACRRVAATIGRALGSPCVDNFWVPDGMKDTPVDRAGARERLTESLDEVFRERIDSRLTVDAVEGKLFGIGVESFTVGSHEFYFGYALTRHKLYTLDTGHYHPTETISDKISAVFCYLPELLLHVSRGVRWDSDHVVTLGDELQSLAQELVRGQYLSHTHLGLDYFDASINRVAAWVIGTRNLQKALLNALLEPIDTLRRYEADGDYTSRLALLEETKSLPSGAVWDYHCLRSEVPDGRHWLDETRRYEREVLASRC